MFRNRFSCFGFFCWGKLLSVAMRWVCQFPEMSFIFRRRLKNWQSSRRWPKWWNPWNGFHWLQWTGTSFREPLHRWSYFQPSQTPRSAPNVRSDRILWTKLMLSWRLANQIWAASCSKTSVWSQKSSAPKENDKARQDKATRDRKMHTLLKGDIVYCV